MRAIKIVAVAVAILAPCGMVQIPKEQTPKEQVTKKQLPKEQLPKEQPPSESKTPKTQANVSEAKIAEIKQAMKVVYAEAWKEGSAVQVALASNGDSARGVILKEDKGELTLDSKPCGGLVLMFTKPYTKREVGQVTCDKRKYPRYEVEQKQGVSDPVSSQAARPRRGGRPSR